ncbi:kinase-like protein [Jackrogersella minutella]|nr:kinase-like protein [Jackrogersella minutella]
MAPRYHLFRFGDIFPHRPKWMRRSTRNIVATDKETEEQQYSETEEVFIKNSLPCTLTDEEFKTLLDKYPSYIRDVYQQAERERFECIPRKLKDRAEPFLEKAELIYMDQWIQKRGTPLKREAHIANAKKINDNKEEDVRGITMRAFKEYRVTQDIIRAMHILKELQGVGDARASLLLSVVYPDTLPFFSRALYQWTHLDEERCWTLTFTWTPDKYLSTLHKVTDLRKKHSVNGVPVRAVDVEKVVFVLEHESAIRGLRDDRIVTSLADGIKYEGDGNAKVYKVLRAKVDKKAGYSALKMMPKTAQVERARNRFLAEVSTSYQLAELCPERFVEFLGWNEDKYSLFIAMEYVEHGDLEKNLNGDRWDEEDIKATAQQLLDGLKIMHDNGIAHRDFKPQNILVVSKQPGHVKVKITDFGLSKRLSNRKTTVLATVGIGTSGYKAPEVVQSWDAEDEQGTNQTEKVANIDSRYSYTYKADLWSLGCVIFRMASGARLFTSDMEVLNTNRLESQVKAIGKLLTETPLPMGETGIKFVKKLIVVEEKDRLDADSALKALDRWE